MGFGGMEWVFGGMEWVFGGMKWVFGGMGWVFGGMEWVFGVGGCNLFSLKTKLSQTGEIGITNITGPQTHYI